MNADQIFFIDKSIQALYTIMTICGVTSIISLGAVTVLCRRVRELEYRVNRFK